MINTSLYDYQSRLLHHTNHLSLSTIITMLNFTAIHITLIYLKKSYFYSALFLVGVDWIASIVVKRDFIDTIEHLSIICLSNDVDKVWSGVTQCPWELSLPSRLSISLISIFDIKKDVSLIYQISPNERFLTFMLLTQLSNIQFLNFIKHLVSWEEKK